MRLDIPFDVPTPIQPAAPAARNPPHAERDAQSARASSLIGDMLLRGYSLLADSCPNSTCYGIPLVGQPRTRRPGGRETGLEDTRKQCVICNRVYDKNGNLVQGGSTARTDAPPAAVNGVQDRQRAAVPATESSALDSPRTLARRALYADGEQANVALRTANKAIDQPEASKALPESKTKLRASDASKSHQVVSESVDTLVTALERLNAELRRMMEHPDIGRTIKDKGMKRCLTRMRDTMEALATAEEVRAKMEQ
ncbi:hypothetical protein QFC22_001587 [Naganishia vaughanmartiniae]|uniref:Uncharacterized protein n=1 Tax=Naganishia vaughanmartiniae TaxID=1424756 RepID=A0ACC2XHS4_9TREE|nr:hypothetical protein QFC22_001587 [Naganishia vaughanmartiniae]